MKCTKENEPNEDFVDALAVQEKVLRLIGVWPLDAETFTSFRRWLVATFIQISSICSLSLEVYRHCHGIDDTMDAFLMDLSSIVSLSKLLIVRFGWKHTYVLVNSIIEDWSTVKDLRHRQIMTEYFERGKLVSLMILYLGYASGASFVLKSLPLDTLIPFSQANFTKENDDEETFRTTYFLATYCVFGTLPLTLHGCVLSLQIMQIFVNATSHCGNDGFFFILVMHLCGQFEILKINLSETEIEEFACRRKIRMLVKRHCRLSLLADNLEQAFNMIILVQLLMSALLLCVEGFQFLVSLKINDNVGALKHAILIVTMLVQLFLYAYAGDVLESHTESVRHAVYAMPWYDFRAFLARNLVLLIARGSSPQQITAGKFLSMNLFTFKEILKTSASYLSVLRIMMETMLKKLWNKDIDYIFSVHKVGLWIFATWPLQRNDIFAITRWILTSVIQILGIISTVIDLFYNRTKNNKTMEGILVFEYLIITISKHVFLTVSTRKLRENITSAIDDWQSKPTNEESLRIMKRYARISRKLTLLVLYCDCICAFFYIIGCILLQQLQSQASIIDNENSTEYTKNREFPLPASWLEDRITETQYIMIIAMQGIQALVYASENGLVDSFFFNIVMHLSGQFEILKTDFGMIGEKKNTETNHRKELRSLIRRHCHLINLAKNLQDSFSIIILLQLGLTAILMAILGYRFIICIKYHDNVELVKGVVTVLFLLIQCFLYVYTSDSLTSRSEEIFQALFSAHWYNLPPRLIRDVTFILLRTQKPLHFSGGKFFVVSRSTIIYILNTAGSYVSVLQVAMKD